MSNLERWIIAVAIVIGVGMILTGIWMLFPVPAALGLTGAGIIACVCAWVREP